MRININKLILSLIVALTSTAPVAGYSGVDSGLSNEFAEALNAGANNDENDATSPDSKQSGETGSILQDIELPSGLAGKPVLTLNDLKQLLSIGAKEQEQALKPSVITLKEDFPSTLEEIIAITEPDLTLNSSYIPVLLTPQVIGEVSVLQDEQKNWEQLKHDAWVGMSPKNILILTIPKLITWASYIAAITVGSALILPRIRGIYFYSYNGSVHLIGSLLGFSNMSKWQANEMTSADGPFTLMKNLFSPSQSYQLKILRLIQDFDLEGIASSVNGSAGEFINFLTTGLQHLQNTPSTAIANSLKYLVGAMAPPSSWKKAAAYGFTTGITASVVSLPWTLSGYYRPPSKKELTIYALNTSEFMMTLPTKFATLPMNIALLAAYTGTHILKRFSTASYAALMKIGTLATRGANKVAHRINPKRIKKTRAHN